MSHFIKFVTQYTSKASLEAAFKDLEALGIKVVRNGVVSGYGRSSQAAEFGIERGQCCVYNYRVNNRRTSRGYGGIALNVNAENGIYEITADALDASVNVDVLTLLKKRYTRHETVAAMEAMGYRIKTEDGDNIEFKATRATARHLRKRAVGKRSTGRRLRIGGRQ